MKDEKQRFWLVTTNELNRLVYNEIQTERYGISKVIKRETLTGMRSFNKIKVPMTNRSKRNITPECCGKKMKEDWRCVPEFGTNTPTWYCHICGKSIGRMI